MHRNCASLEQWNTLADADRMNVVGLLGRLSGQQV